MFHVVVQEKGGKTQHYSFHKPEILIGRVQGNDIVLPIGAVSKKHTKVMLTNDKIIVIDMNSTNGTYVNGQKITAPQIVTSSDRVFIGDFMLQLLQEGEVPLDAAETGDIPHSAVPPININAASGPGPVKTTEVPAFSAAGFGPPPLPGAKAHPPVPPPIPAAQPLSTKASLQTGPMPMAPTASQFQRPAPPAEAPQMPKRPEAPAPRGMATVPSGFRPPSPGFKPSPSQPSMPTAPEPPRQPPIAPPPPAVIAPPPPAVIAPPPHESATDDALDILDSVELLPSVNIPPAEEIDAVEEELAPAAPQRLPSQPPARMPSQPPARLPSKAPASVIHAPAPAATSSSSRANLDDADANTWHQVPMQQGIEYSYASVQGGWLLYSQVGMLFLPDPEHRNPPIPVRTSK